MKTNLKGRIVGAGCLLMASASAMATPFQRGDLPADTAWAVHVDCDLLRTGTVGQYLQEELRRPEVQAKLAAFQALFSFDLQKQLHALTLYSASIDPKDGVLVIYGDFDAAHLLTLVKGADDYEGITHNQRVIHSWIDKNKKGHPHIYAALQGGRLHLRTAPGRRRHSPGRAGRRRAQPGNRQGLP